MKTFRYLIIIFSVIVSIVFAIGLMLPKTFEVKRSIQIDATIEEIQPFISDLTYWPEWTVWNKETDPSIEFTYSDHTTGMNATQHWKGDIAGEGHVTIQRIDLERGLYYEMALNEDITFYGNFQLEEERGKTKLTWTKEGRLKNNPLMGYQALLVDGSLGPELEAGLQQLKKLVEEN